MDAANIFAESFSAEPWWWEGFRPPADPPCELPRAVDVLVVGAGYAGVHCALTLAEHGRDVLVLDAQALGWGAASRSGGQVTGGANVGKTPGGGNTLARRGTVSDAPADDPVALRRRALLLDAAAAMRHLESTIQRHGIRCGLRLSGRLTALWTPAHWQGWERRLEDLNRYAAAEARMVPRDAMREEVGTDFYAGGVLIGRGGHLQPAELFGGLLLAARRAGARAHGETPVEVIERVGGGGWQVRTPRGTVRAEHVVIATNGYTGGLNPALRRRTLPVTTHMIATETLPEGMARRIMPRDRGVSETRRVVNHYRLSPDGSRLLFGGRARFFPAEERATAAILHRQMVRRFPEMASVRIINSWGGKVAVSFDYVPHIGQQDGIHYALGCNGSGVVMMNWLGHGIARRILEGGREPVNAFDTGGAPTHPLYQGVPWFVPVVGTYYQVRDWNDRRRS